MSGEVVRAFRVSTDSVRNWQRLFGASFTDRGMRKLLRRLGFSFQRRGRRAVEADPEAPREWTERRKRAAIEQAQMMFSEQVGVCSDHLCGRTWGWVGQTPLLPTSGNRFGFTEMRATGIDDRCS